MTKLSSKFICKEKWSIFIERRHIDKFIKAQSRNESNFRILKISHYNPNIKTITNFLSDNEQIRKLLVASSYLFFLSIEPVCEDFDVTTFKSVVIDIFKDSGKSFLIELCYTSKKIVRYIFEKNSLEQLSDEKLVGFFGMQCINKSLCDLTMSDDNLLNDEQWKPIPIRLMKTFDIKFDEHFEKNILKTFVTKSNLRALQAYLDLPIIDDGKSLQQTLLTIKAVNYKYQRNETLLFFAANGDFDVLKLLLRLGADVQVENSDSETASDRAKSYENLQLLLEYDARFPHRFHETYNEWFKNSTGIKEEILKICSDRDKFHAAITAKDANQIKKFKTEFPCLQFAYTFTEKPRYSKAATTTALEAAINTVDEDYTMFSLLLDEGFRLNEADLDFMDIRNANKNKINALTLSRLKREQPSHIAFLLSVTKIYGVRKGKHEKYMKKMHNIYLELNKYDKLTNLLKLLQHSKSLIVSVDFRNGKTGSMDLNGICKGFDGLTYYELGRIYVGAAGKSNEEIAGILIHELTHYVLHIVFNNGCKPYYKSDESSRDDFYEIIKNIEAEKRAKHVVVQNVFNCYPKKYRPKELIVTVTQMIALKVNELELKDKYAALYNYFCVNVLAIINKLSTHPEEFLIKREVQQLNEFLGHSEEIENWNIWPQKSYLRPEMHDGDIQLVVCDTPKLFLADFYKSIVKPTLICSPDSIDVPDYLRDYFILAAIEDFKCASKSAYIKRIWHLSSDIMLVLNCDKYDELDETFRERQIDYINDSDTSKNLVAFARDDGILRSIFATKNETLCLEYAWGDLEQSSKSKLLATEIDFQDARVKLNKLIDDTFSEVPMKQLINGEKIVIQASKVLVDNYDNDKFVDRSFTEYRNLDQILSTTKDETFSFLLSGEAGIGKSTMLSRITLQLKEKNPLCWVTRINLHEHVEAFEDNSINVSDPLEIVFKYFVRTATSSQRVFEHKLIQKLYKESKMILLLDAVDEIAPRFVQQVSSLIRNLSDKIQLWITTRPHLKNELEFILSNKIILQLNPFTISDQIECVTKYWKKELNLTDAATNLFKMDVCADKIITRFTESIDEFVCAPEFGAPLLSSMIAETHLNYVEEYVNSNEEVFALREHIDIFDLFDTFVSKKILSVSSEKGILVANEKIKNEIFSRDTIAIFERFALKFIFKPNADPEKSYIYRDAHFLDRPLNIDSHNMQRYGLLLLSSNGEPYFIHKTFAEFFVANFIVKSLKNAPYANDTAAKCMFETAMDILCKNIISIEQEHFTLMKFINGGMKYLWNGENEHEAIFQAYCYFKTFVSHPDNVQPELSLKSKFHNLDCMLAENSVVLLQFFLEFLTLDDDDHQIVEQLFTDYSIFSQASDKSVRCIIEYLWGKCSSEDFVIHMFTQDPTGSKEFNPLQLAFMNFPRNNMTVVRDITNLEQLKDALIRKDVFDEILHKTTDEKYKNSTLKLFVNIILDPKSHLSENEKNSFIYEYAEPDVNYDYEISEEHFDDFIEMKWMAMKDLAFPVDDWDQLVNKTIFENVIRLIFHEFNNRNVLKFYKWAKGKANDNVAFEHFVADSFSKYIWNCKSENGVKEIFDFIRSEVDIKQVLRQYDFADIWNERFENEFYSVLQDRNFFAVCRKYFTEEEFEILLFKPLRHAEDKLISKFFEFGDGLLLETVILAILPLSTKKEFVTKIIPEMNSKLLFNLFNHVFGYSKSNIVTIKRVLHCVNNISTFEHIRSALQHTKNDFKTVNPASIKRILNSVEITSTLEDVRDSLRHTHTETLFHVAAKRRDLSIFQLIWKLARPILSDDELKDLLSFRDADDFLLIHNVASKGFTIHPPSILNTNCRTAAFEFIPFKFGDSIPEMAIQVNEKKCRKPKFIGPVIYYNPPTART